MTLATKFLSLSPEQRGLVFEQAAAGLAGHDVILEKDFWVSWLLGLLFAQPKLAPFLVFKGGTSLSKVFGVIDRFSEDIDLCLGPEFVGADTATQSQAADSRWSMAHAGPCTLLACQYTLPANVGVG